MKKAGGEGLTAAARCWNGSLGVPRRHGGPQMAGAGRLRNTHVFFLGVESEHCPATQLSRSACRDTHGPEFKNPVEIPHARLAGHRPRWRDRAARTFLLSMLRRAPRAVRRSLHERAFSLERC